MNVYICCEAHRGSLWRLCWAAEELQVVCFLTALRLFSATKFGAMMDMLTDRCATMCLLVNLSLLYPSYTFLFQLSMCVDIASHWLHLHR